MVDVSLYFRPIFWFAAHCYNGIYYTAGAHWLKCDISLTVRFYFNLNKAAKSTPTLIQQLINNSKILLNSYKLSKHPLPYLRKPSTIHCPIKFALETLFIDCVSVSKSDDVISCVFIFIFSALYNNFSFFQCFFQFYSFSFIQFSVFSIRQLSDI